MRIQHILFIGVICVFAAHLQAQTVMTRDVIAGGATDMSGSSHRLTGTVGQAVIGVSSSGTRIAGQGFWYQLQSIPVEVDVQPSMPHTPVLHQNYPNPFNPSTLISFTLPSRSHVRLSLYRPSGSLLDVLIDEMLESGIHRVHFEAGDLSAGVYLCRLTVGDFNAEQKMLLLK